MKPSIYIKQCPHCQGVKKFLDFVPIDPELQKAIDSGMVRIKPCVCPKCFPGGSNKLLPVEDKNEKALATS